MGASGKKRQKIMGTVRSRRLGKSELGVGDGDPVPIDSRMESDRD